MSKRSASPLLPADAQAQSKQRHDEDEKGMETTKDASTSATSAPVAVASAPKRSRPLFIPSSASAKERAALEAKLAEQHRVAAEKKRLEEEKQKEKAEKRRKLDEDIAFERQRQVQQAEEQRLQLERIAQSNIQAARGRAHADQREDDDEDGELADAGEDQDDSDAIMHDASAAAAASSSSATMPPIDVTEAGLKIRATSLAFQSPRPSSSRRVPFIRPVALPSSFVPSDLSDSVLANLSLTIFYLDPSQAEYPEEALNYFGDEFEPHWRQYAKDSDTKNAVRQIMWRTASYALEQELAITAEARLRWCVEEEGRMASAAAASSGAVAVSSASSGRSSKAYQSLPGFVHNFYDRTRYSRSSTATSSASSASTAALSSSTSWIPTFSDFIDVCRAWGADLRTQTIEIDAQQEEKNSHQEEEKLRKHRNFMDYAQSSTLFAPPSSVAAAASSSPPSDLHLLCYPSCFSRTLNLFSLHLSHYPHSRIFRDMSERYDCLLLLFQLMRDTNTHPECTIQQECLEGMIERIIAGIGNDAKSKSNMQMHEENDVAASSPFISDSQFETLVCLFLSPLISTSLSTLVSVLQLASGADTRNADSLTQQVMRSAAMAMAVACARKQALSSSPLQRVVTSAQFASLLDESKYLKEILPNLRIAGNKVVIQIQCIVLLGRLLLTRDTPHDVPSHLTFLSFLDRVRHGIGTSVVSTLRRELKELCEVTSAFLSSLRSLHRAIMQRANREAIQKVDEEEEGESAERKAKQTRLQLMKMEE